MKNAKGEGMKVNTRLERFIIINFYTAHTTLSMWFYGEGWGIHFSLWC
jgi:hypothetical protein